MFADNNAPMESASLEELTRRFVSLRQHYTRVCEGLMNEVYPLSEEERVSDLIEDLAAEISTRVTNWRTE